MHARRGCGVLSDAQHCYASCSTQSNPVQRASFTFILDDKEGIRGCSAPHVTADDSYRSFDGASLTFVRFSPWNRWRAAALPQSGPTRSHRPRSRRLARLRDDESTAARLLSFERRKLITVKRKSIVGRTRFAPLAAYVPSSHAYSLRHPFLNCLTAPMSNPTKIGGQEPSEPPSAEPPSAETAEDVYIYPLTKIRSGMAGDFCSYAGHV